MMSELLTNVVTGILVAFLLGRFATGLGGFASGGVLVFLIGWTSLSVPYWNWYGFPAAFTIAEMIDQLVSGAVVGLVIGLFLRSKRS